MTDFNKLAADIFAQNKEAGWWDDMNRCPYTTLQLVSTEIAEATEGERKNLMDDKLPHRKMGEVELADALIRVLDFGGRYGILAQAGVLGKIPGLDTPYDYTAPKWHYLLNRQLFCFGDSIVTYLNAGHTRFSRTVAHEYTYLIGSLLDASASLGYDIMAAMEEKREYNKTRQDHTREHRATENGKKF